MLNKTFIGAQKRLDEYDIPRMAHRIDVSEDHFRAFFEVESGGKAFDAKGRPAMLFEPHVFYRNLPTDSLRKTAVAAGLARPKWVPGKYLKDSYPTLLKAMALDADAALKACSIGLSQVLVENHVSVGYATPQAMWQAFMDDEEKHVEAMLRFILANGIDDDLRAERWAVVARVYNGPRYKANNYDAKMAAAFAKHKKIPDSDWTPDLPDPKVVSTHDKATIKSVQRKLVELGYPEVGREDGVWGTKTRAAVLGFRADNGLPIIADIDNDLLSALMLAEPRKVSEERSTATASDLKDMGAENVVAASKTESAGYITVAGGAAAAVTSLLEKSKELSGITDQFAGVIDSVKAISPWLIVAFGAYVVYQQWIVKRSTVQDYRTGRYVGN